MYTNEKNSSRIRLARTGKDYLVIFKKISSQNENRARNYFEVESLRSWRREFCERFGTSVRSVRSMESCIEGELTAGCMNFHEAAEKRERLIAHPVEPRVERRRRSDDISGCRQRV